MKNDMITLLPDVSLVMATFNDNPDLLKIAINSILNQTFTNWELIIVDDSKDISTIKVIDDYCVVDNRIRVIRSTSESYGFVPALNVGLRNAKGRFIGRMDGDDISHPERLMKEVAFLNEHPEFDVVGTHTSIINSTGSVTSAILFPDTGRNFRMFQIMRCPMQHGTILMRRKLVDSGINYDENFKRSEDLELWLRLQKLGHRLYNIQEILYDFRIDDGYGIKRSKIHFKYNIKARKKNLHWRHPFTGLMGLCVACMYYYIPTSIKNKVYNYLNGR